MLRDQGIRTQKRKQSQGITLLEMVTAVAILGILSLLAVPLLSTFLQKYRIATAGDALYFSLQYARSEAVKRNNNIYVSFITGDTWCYGINVGSACDCATPSGCSLGTVSYQSAQQFSLTTSGFSGSSIFFEGSHGAANSSGSITFTQYNQATPLITISFGRLGNLQICTTDINGYTSC